MVVSTPPHRSEVNGRSRTLGCRRGIGDACRRRLARRTHLRQRTRGGMTLLGPTWKTTDVERGYPQRPARLHARRPDVRATAPAPDWPVATRATASSRTRPVIDAVSSVCAPLRRAISEVLTASQRKRGEGGASRPAVFVRRTYSLLQLRGASRRFGCDDMP